jgi:tRNA A37 methylthiotransferase MiaB
MMNPMYVPEMLDSLVDTFKRNDKLFKFLHIPVESGSERILRKMKRGHTARTFLDAVSAFRKAIPEIAVSTDIIVGFPSETEEDFQDTLDLVATAEPDTVNISRYGARPGTESAAWKDDRISSQVAKDRSGRLHALARDIARKRNSLWVGWQGEIIIDEIKNGTAQGRNYAYKSVVLDQKNNAALGQTKRIKVYDFSKFSLKARILQAS